MTSIALPPPEVGSWSTDQLSDEAVRAIQSCRKYGQAAAQHAWKAGAYLSLLHDRLIKGRKWAAWLRQHQDIITEDTARRYILLHERTGNRTKLKGLTLTEAYAAFGITRYVDVAPAEPASNGRGPLSGDGGHDADHRLLPAPTPFGSDGQPRPAGFQLSSLIVEPRASQGASDPEEEAILRAAAEIRKRRVLDRWNQLQDQRLKTQPKVSLKKGSASVLCGDCISLIPQLDDGSVSLVVTSPPYCEQRAGHYEGVPEDQYPEFTVAWMAALRPKLREDGSVLIVIRPHLRDGIVSDYVLRTRLALRDQDWCECEELIWFKPNAPPLGSKVRPRRSWESILWYSGSNKPYCDLKACGKESSRIGFDGSVRFADQGVSDQTGWHPCVESVGQGIGTARVPDVVVVPVGTEEPRVDHPAVFPLALADQLVRTFSQEGDLVLDPFCGSGQTLLAAKGCGRRYLGIEREEKFVKVALGRLK